MGSQQSARQVARRAALDAQARMRAQRAEQEKRRSALGVVVVQALAERDATRAACEQRAGEALRVLVEDEGLPLSAAVTWCGGGLGTREAARLRRLTASQAGGEQVEEPADGRAGAGDSSTSDGAVAKVPAASSAAADAAR